MALYSLPDGTVVSTEDLDEAVVLDRTLWLNEDKSKVVEDGDLDAAHLYGNRGRVVSKAEAEKLGALPKKDVDLSKETQPNYEKSSDETRELIDKGTQTDEQAAAEKEEKQAKTVSNKQASKSANK